jgi:hypothetical protein
MANIVAAPFWLLQLARGKLRRVDCAFNFDQVRPPTNRECTAATVIVVDERIDAPDLSTAPAMTRSLFAQTEISLWRFSRDRVR